MKIGLVSTAVPFINGGARFIVEWLRVKLAEQGHEVEIIYIPSTEELDHILPQMAAINSIKLDDYFDRIITFRPPSHMVRHPRKVVWFIHHIRMLYDMWDSPYRSFPDNRANRELRDAVIAADTKALKESHLLFTNSQVVRDRVRVFNGIESEVLYPPILNPELFRSGPYNGEIVSVCRMEGHKRQHVLVEAMSHTRTSVRLRLCGASSNPEYIEDLRSLACRLGVTDRITFHIEWISEEEKAALLSEALASVYIPYDEDSYGYPTIEAAHAERSTVTMSDSGGVPEFVVDGKNGLVTAPTAPALADAFDLLFTNRTLAKEMGQNARARVKELGIDWDTVLTRLLA